MEGCNPKRTKQILKVAIHEICGEIPLSAINVFVGIAGGSSESMKVQFSQFFAEMDFRAAEIDSDSMNIIAAGLDGKDSAAFG